jgi:MFS superfamily sulfate permease-like transporter
MTESTASSTTRVKADSARIDRLKEQLRSTPQEIDFERVRVMAEVYEETAGYQQIITRAKFFAELIERKKLYIDDNLFVGSMASTVNGSHFVPTENLAVPDESGLVVYRFESALYFANANVFVEEIEALVAQGPPKFRWFVLDAEAMVDIDTTGAEALHQVLGMLAKRNVTFALARANPRLPPLLKRYELLESIGENRLYPTNRHAVDAFRQECKM